MSPGAKVMKSWQKLFLVMSDNEAVNGGDGGGSSSSPDGDGDGGGSPDDTGPQDDGGASSPDGGAGEGKAPNGADNATLDALRAAEAKRAKLEQQLQKYQQQEEEKKKAKMSEHEKLQAKLEEERKARQELENSIREQRVENALQNAARKHGLTDPGDFLKLVDRSGIETDDEGQVVGAEKAMVELKKRHPRLFEEPNKTPASTSNPDSGSGKTGDRDGTDGGANSEREKGRAIAKKYNKPTDRKRQI